MKRRVGTSILLFLAVCAALITGGVFLPGFTHAASKTTNPPLHCLVVNVKGKKTCQPVKSKPPFRCGAIVGGKINLTTGKASVVSGKQPCIKTPTRYQHYVWTSDGKSHSPFMSVPYHWTLSYICDGGPGILEINNSQWLLERAPMTCDNIWHREPLIDTGSAVQVWASRVADFLVA